MQNSCAKQVKPTGPVSLGVPELDPLLFYGLVPLLAVLRWCLPGGFLEHIIKRRERVEACIVSNSGNLMVGTFGKQGFCRSHAVSIDVVVK